MQQFDYERLDVYGLALDFVVTAAAIAQCASRGHGDLADQLRRASTSILLNLAEGAGEFASKEKACFYRLSKRSATECVALVEVFHRLRLIDDEVQIDGKPVNEYIVERDYLFGMGDHRDNSLDGRYWGFIPKQNLVGTPLIVYWSWDTNIPLYDIFSKLASIRWGRVGTLIH